MECNFWGSTGVYDDIVKPDIKLILEEVMGVFIFSAIKIFLGWTPVEINPCPHSAVLFLSCGGMLVLL